MNATQLKAHESNMDAAYREISSRQLEGEDMSNATIDPVTYVISKNLRPGDEAREAFYKAAAKKHAPVAVPKASRSTARAVPSAPWSGGYLVTVTGFADGEERVLAVDATKSSQARRLAKQEVKAAGQSLDGLTFSAARM